MNARDCITLDLTDPHALPAIAAYATACEGENPQRAAELRTKLAAIQTAASEFVTVPDTTLPNGLIVPAFRVSRFLMAHGVGDIPLSVPHLAPWVRINYEEARTVSARAGLNLITETQALALAWNVSQQDANWSGGKVGEGKLRMGLHKGTVDEAQPATTFSADAEEQRWFVLSNGERICDVAGNAYSWIFDDVQGDENGIIAREFAKDSPSITTPPYPSMEKGVGWQPNAGADWSGRALVRGGYWCSGSDAGVFDLDGGWPAYRHGCVGFRCTQPIGL